jgi:hypothetical protein
MLCHICYEAISIIELFIVGKSIVDEGKSGYMTVRKGIFKNIGILASKKLYIHHDSILQLFRSTIDKIHQTIIFPHTMEE